MAITSAKKFFANPFISDKKIITINDEVTCTEDHKFFVIDKKDKDIVTDENVMNIGKWVDAKDLTSEMLLVKNNK